MPTPNGPHPYRLSDRRAPQPHRPHSERVGVKFWYCLAATLIMASALWFAANRFVLALDSEARPKPQNQFTSGASSRVHLEPGVDQIVFWRAKSALDAAHERPVRCDFLEKTGDVHIARYPTLTIIGSWVAAFTVTVTEAGDYTITCTGSPTDTFATGTLTPHASHYMWLRILCGLGHLAAGALGAIALVVTAVRQLRRRASQRHKPAPATT